MNKEKKQSLIAKLILFATTLLWGSSFFIVKRTVEEIPVFTLLLIRFSISFVLMMIIFAPKIKKINFGVVAKGILAGTPLALAYVFQTEAIKYTTASNNAFLTATYCVMIPFMTWAVYKKRPAIYNFIAAVICIVGIGLATLQNGLAFNYMGDGFTLIAAFFFAVNIMLIEKFTKDVSIDAMMFTAFQFIPIIIAALIGFLIKEQGQAVFTKVGIGGLMYLTICGSVLALSMMSIGIKYTSAFSAGLIMSLEAVFGVVFAVIFSKEHLHWLTYVSFIVIFIGMMVSEASPYFVELAKKKRERASNEDVSNNILQSDETNID
ncbi:MAG: DMT family transporter [Clostridiales bacterium]|jgi:drug/metabolite transporter (DMT)-like permease|nr:DMT family transporter [Clostridiales bacterium]